MVDELAAVAVPSYSPELNPAEKIWAKFKRDFTNRLFKTLDNPDKYVSKLANSIITTEIKSICSFNYIFEGLFELKFNSLLYNFNCWLMMNIVFRNLFT
jgi:transposase